MMMDCKCAECSRDFKIDMDCDKFCVDCHPITKKIKSIDNELKKAVAEIETTIDKGINYPKNKWTTLKAFSYITLFYFPMSMLIARSLGLSYQIIWVFGGIYFTVVPRIIEWLMDIF